MEYSVTPPSRHHGDSSPCPVPLSPHALSQHSARYLEFLRSRRLPPNTTFARIAL
jgi:hypothetical protein